MAARITDPRFAKIQTDPRYRLPAKKRSKVQLDSRFSRMLKDDDFLRKARVDRYGRPIEKHRGKKDLKRFYRIEDNDEDEDGDEDDQASHQAEDKQRAKLGLRPDSDESGEDDEVVGRELRRIARQEQGYDPARDGGFSSSESESSSDEEEEEELDEADVLEPVSDVPTGEVTSRLALVNMDWDNLRAVDLMAVAASFAPRNGTVLDVTVYPSKFGRERLDREALEGPPAEIFTSARSHNEELDVEDEESEEFEEDESDPEADEKLKKSLVQEGEAVDFNSTALRRYQLDRLRYYYAVITCSSEATAKALYDDMDGREYLSSANFFDLRFIPDDVSFDEDEPRDTCEKVPDGYRPSEFVTDALQHSKVKLTWDADDKERKDAQQKAFQRGKLTKEEAEYDDLAAYIGSGSDTSEAEASDKESGEEEQASASNPFGLNIPSSTGDLRTKSTTQKDRAAALRAALGLDGAAPTKSKKSESKMPTGNMEITFSAGLSTDLEQGDVFLNQPEETTQERYVRRERERKARRKERRKNGQGGIDTKIEDAAAVPVMQKTERPAESGFEDSFFENPELANRNATRDAKRAEREKLKQERESEAAALSKQRAELELLIGDDDALGKGVRHFNMNDIIKQEKAARRKGKGKKSKHDTNGIRDDVEQDRFEVAVDDPRFSKLYESHEFAIDPTDSRFKDTRGMKALLDEGRRRRGKRKDHEGTNGNGTHVSKKVKARDPHGADGADGTEDLKSLVAKVKRKVAS